MSCPRSSQILLAFIVAGTFGVATLARMETKSGGVEAEAYGAGVTAVKRSLKDPSSAVFDHSSGFQSLRSDGLAEVGGIVRANNSLGGKEMESWRCLLDHKDGDNWAVVYLKVGRVTTGLYRAEK